MTDGVTPEDHAVALARLETKMDSIASELRHEVRNVQTENQLIRSVQTRDDIRTSRLEKFALAQDDWNKTVMDSLGEMQKWSIPDGFEATIKDVIQKAQRESDEERWKRLRRYWWAAGVALVILSAIAPNLVHGLLQAFGN